MWKKAILVNWCIFMMLSGGCLSTLESNRANNDYSESPESSVAEDLQNSPGPPELGNEQDFPIVLKATEYYKLVKYKEDEYVCYIFNKMGDVVLEIDDWRWPSIDAIDSSYVTVRIGIGTGIWRTLVYDIENDRYSEWLYSARLSIEYGLAVQMVLFDDTIKLIVRDIFDESKFYKEFELDFSQTAIPANMLVNIEFIDKDTLMVTYLSGSEYEEKTAILHLMDL